MPHPVSTAAGDTEWYGLVSGNCNQYTEFCDVQDTCSAVGILQAGRFERASVFDYLYTASSAVSFRATMRRYGTLADAGGRGSRRRENKATPPFPTKHMIVLACCRICEAIAFMSIFPYIYYMIEDFHITNHSSKISVYAGMVTSAFTLAEFATGVLWGRLSDKIGRKPVLLFGLAGTALSVLIFGFAPNLPVALIARALGGLLNGNIGVLQTTVAELVTVKEQQPRAYTIMPMVWWPSHLFSLTSRSWSSSCLSCVVLPLS
ncbi:hypothetical protein V2G26_014733 [Clonostachys chloroleuca]